MDAYTLSDELRYTASHLWVRVDGSVATVGLTEHGQTRHGKVLFVGLPAVGAPVGFGMPFGYLQSAGYGLTHLFPPVQGEVSAINDELWAKPYLLNDDPLDEGWLVAITMSNPAELDDLDSADDYRATLAGERSAHSVTLPPHLRELDEPVFLIDDRRHILSSNAAAEALIGLSAKEMAHGPLCQELFGCQVSPDHPMGKHECPGLCSLLNLEPVIRSYTITDAKGETRQVEAEYTPLAEPGQPRRAVVVLRPAN